MVADSNASQQSLPVFSGEEGTITYAEWRSRARLLAAVRKYEQPAVEITLRLASEPYNLVTQAVSDLTHPTAFEQVFGVLDRHHLSANEDVKTMLDLLGASPGFDESVVMFAKRFDTLKTLAGKNGFEMNSKCHGALLLH